MKKVLKMLLAIYCVICALVTVWFLLSWFEVICKNLSINPEYSALNLLTLIY